MCVPIAALYRYLLLSFVCTNSCKWTSVPNTVKCSDQITEKKLKYILSSFSFISLSPHFNLRFFVDFAKEYDNCYHNKGLNVASLPNVIFKVADKSCCHCWPIPLSFYIVVIYCWDYSCTEYGLNIDRWTLSNYQLINHLNMILSGVFLLLVRVIQHWLSMESSYSYNMNADI